jgi:hypothetical protein
MNWAIELSEFDIDFIFQSAIKGPALTDFLVEFTNILEEGEASVVTQITN